MTRLSYYIEFCGLYLSDVIATLSHYDSSFHWSYNTLLMIGNVPTLLLMMKINVNYFYTSLWGLINWFVSFHYKKPKRIAIKVEICTRKECKSFRIGYRQVIPSIEQFIQIRHLLRYLYNNNIAKVLPWYSIQQFVLNKLGTKYQQIVYTLIPWSTVAFTVLNTLVTLFIIGFQFPVHLHVS